jgi:hypothetical protein
MATQLPESCFLVLATFVYADGHIRTGELDGFRRAAKLYGLEDAELSHIESRARDGLLLDEIELPPLTEWQKSLCYAFAVWVAKVDGIINREENELLQALGGKLSLEKLRRDAARSATYDIAALPGGHKPELFDLAALEEQLKKKLPGSYRKHQTEAGKAEPHLEEPEVDEE